MTSRPPARSCHGGRPRFRHAGIFLLLAFLLQAPFLPAADFHISTQADFDTYANATFQPGDRILLKRGAVFDGMLAPRGSGTAGNVITISAFGTGKLPLIRNNGVVYPAGTARAAVPISAGIFLYNTEYWEVENIEVTNNNGGDQDADNLIGIYVLAEDTGQVHNHIHIRNCHVHHVNGAVEGKLRGGIHVHGKSPTSGNHPRFNDLRIVGNRVEHVGGVGIGNDGDQQGIGSDKAVYHTGPGNRANAWTNVYVANNHVAYTGRNGIIARDSDHAIYEYNTVAHSSLYSKGHSIFCFNTWNIKIQYNEAYGNVGSEGSDRGGFDADFNCLDTYIQYNYSHDNMWFCGIMKKPNRNIHIRHNLSVNEKAGAYFYGFNNRSDAEEIHIYNNTHYFSNTIAPKIIVEDRIPLNTTFRNNIFYCEGSGEWGDSAESGVNVLFENNLYHNLAPHGTDSQAIVADPQFVAPGAAFEDVDMQTRAALNGYRLAATSPAINAGVDTSYAGAMDLWGRSFPDGAPDVGAGEWYNEPLRSYDTWVDDHELSGPDAQFTADCDGDGIENGFEFGFGLHPKVRDTLPSHLDPLSADTLSFTYQVDPHAAGLRFRLLESRNFLDWSPVPGNPTTIDPGTGLNEVRYELATQHEARRFFRLELRK